MPMAVTTNTDRDVLNILLAKLTVIESQMNKVDKLDAKIETLVEKQSQSSLEIGKVYELALRTRIEQEYGRSYARQFYLDNLLGLARLALSKRDVLKYAHEQGATLQLFDHESRAMTLVDFILKNDLHLELGKRLLAIEEKKRLLATAPATTVPTTSSTPPNSDDDNEHAKYLKELAKLKYGKEYSTFRNFKTPAEEVAHNHDFKLLTKSSLGLACFSCIVVDSGYKHRLKSTSEVE